MDNRNLIAFLEEVHKTNLECLKLCPEDKLKFTALKGTYTLADLLKHMYANQRFYNQTAISGRMDVADYKAFMAKKFDKKEDLKKFMQETFSETKKILRQKDILSKKVSTIVGVRSIENLYIGELEHQFHHRGQIYTYLRLLGIKPPKSGYFMGIE